MKRNVDDNVKQIDGARGWRLSGRSVKGLIATCLLVWG